MLQTIGSRPFDDYTLRGGNVTITQTVELRGYEDSSSRILSASEDTEDPYYHLVFTLEQTT